MATIVFFRAVNVGGHQTFQPARLAKELAAFEVVSIGAAGTFVVRAKVPAARLRAEILRRLPFAPEMMFCPGAAIVKLVQESEFGRAEGAAAGERFVSVLARTPRTLPPLPYEYPAGNRWEVQLVACVGPLVLSRRRPGRTYANAVVEKHFGLAATTRNWNTITTIAKYC
ncbi:MAG TPA: hypothetical protein VL527_16820 [Dongiaceae bacterium]|nr:hypothetical protein [Dongiaceae bacterium]